MQETESTELLVALLKRKSALDILKSERWYHIPVETAPKRWPPKVLAFYQGRVFGREEAYKIRYFGEVSRIDIVRRKELFPDDVENQHKAENLYYCLQISNLEERSVPIVSYRPRRLVFIPTTLHKFNDARQINDLFDASPIEDLLWNALKHVNIQAERQWKIVVQGHNYYLDFAVFCNRGRLAIETDGYTYHYDSRNQIDYDTWRQNEIELDEWRFLHYTTKQVRDDWTPYLAQIRKAVDQLGGLQEPEMYQRKVEVRKDKYIVDGEEPF